MPTTRAYDAKRRAEQPWRKLYKTARWEKLRQRTLREQPLCRRCEALGRVVEATTVHHKRAHRGDRALFFDPANLEGVCQPCHDGPCQAEEKGIPPRGVGIDGRPSDPQHPWNAR